MISKFKTLIWLLKRTSYWRHTLSLIFRKFYPNKDSPALRDQATKWAASNSVSVKEALKLIGLLPEDNNLDIKLSEALIKQAKSLADKSKVKMGGAGDLDLLYSASKLSNAKKILETGVAYGWSSMAILASISNKEDAKLISIDMPYPKMNNEEFVGVVVPDSYRDKWELIREPDRNGIKKALIKFGGTIDLCHYDSDKSYYGRLYAYPILWNALNNGGVFISDDIQDNLAFKEFVESRGLNFAVTKCEGKYIGLVFKK